MAVLVGFHCAVINGKLAWRGVRRGSAEAGSSACGRVNAVGLTSILRGVQFFLVHLLKERPPVTLNSIVYFQFTSSRSLRTPHVSQNPDTVTDRVSVSGRAISLRFVSACPDNEFTSTDPDVWPAG